MKKIIFLLLISMASYGQADFPEGLQISGGQPTVTSVNFLTGTNPDGLQVKINTSNITAGFLSDRGTFDASTGLFPTTGGSGSGGAVKKGDIWYSVTNGTLGSKIIKIDDSVRALVDNPGQSIGNWSTMSSSFDYVVANNSLVAHLAGSETFTGNKTFTGTVSVQTPTASTHAVTKAYADGLVVGLLDDRGSYNASSNTFPVTGGSGTAGAILKGDLWYVSVAGVLAGKAVNVGDSFRALTDSPGQTAGNWSVLSANLGYVPANDANVLHTTGNETKTGVLTLNNTTGVSGGLSLSQTSTNTTTTGVLNVTKSGGSNSPAVVLTGTGGGNGSVLAVNSTETLGTILTGSYSSLQGTTLQITTSGSTTSGAGLAFTHSGAMPALKIDNSGAGNSIQSISSGSNTFTLSKTGDGFFSGKLGVGTSAITGKLHVKTGLNENVAFISSAGRVTMSAFNDAVTANIGMDLDAQDYRISTSGAQRVIINSAGLFSINGLMGAGDRDVVVDSNGAFKISANLTGSASLDFPSTASNAESSLTITVAGASVGDIISLGGPAWAANTMYMAFVSAADTVTIRYRNMTVSAIDPAAATFKVKIFK